MLDTSQEQYLREDLLDLYKNPVNKGRLEDPSVSVHDVNPMCGDVIDLDIVVDNGIITDAKFSGDACAVSVISSSLVTEDIIDKDLTYAKNLTKKEVLELIGVDLTTSRVKCATLVLSALHKAIQKYEETTK